MVREYLLIEDIDLLIAVLDTKHLERNLYLLLQIAEMRKPLLFILNMMEMDEATTAGKIINTDALAKQLGVPVIPSVATNGKNA